MPNENEIKKFMAEKLSEEISLSEIQKLIEEKFNKRMTFMDVRLMASTLDSIDWEKEAAKETAAEEAGKKAEQEAAEAEKDAKPPAAPGDGACHVELSKLVKPGAVAHGSVKFPSGASGNWVLDQHGRLGMEKSEGEATEEDLKAFQAELQNMFAKGA